jgi:hypothetical protein
MFFLVSKDYIFVNIQAGMNAVGVKLGNGWYSAEQHGAGYYGKEEHFFFSE